MAAEWQELRDHAWRYFTLHADQRLKTFNFYLIVATVLLGGGLTALKDNVLPQPGAALAFYSLAVLSFVFWKLDQRNRELVKHGEAALLFIEARLPAPLAEDAPELRIFAHEAETTADARRKQSWWRLWSRPMSYSDCFGMVFGTVATIGLTLGTTAAIQAFR
jgi:hypothetical protein